jgi:competence protein ComEA
MEAGASSTATATPARTEPSALLTAWPRSAQLALAFLLGVATTLLAVQAYRSMPSSTRPSELERGFGLAYRIDLNQADRAELLQIPGLGENLAQRIEEYRRQHGAFRSVNELTQVGGIGPATLERWRSWLHVTAGVAEEDGALDQRPLARKTSDNSSKGNGDQKPGGKAAKLQGPVDINRATAAELQRLPGIGPKLSQRIIDERSKRPFKSVDELRRVSGIGPRALERLRPHVVVEGHPQQVVAADKS